MQYIEAVVHKLAPFVQESLEKLQTKPQEPQYLFGPLGALKKGFEAMRMLVDLQNKHLVLEPQKINFVAHSEHLLESFWALARSQKVEYHYFIDPAMPSEVVVDWRVWTFILSTFVENALTHNFAQGSCHVYIKHLPQEEGVITLQLSVTDSGKGIDKEHMPNLLRPFYPTANGLGIDIAVTYRLLKLMQSGLKIASTPNKGSRFGCSLTLLTQGKSSFPPLPQKRVAFMVDDKSLSIHAKMAQQYLAAWDVTNFSLADEHDERIAKVDVVLLFAINDVALLAIQSLFPLVDVILVSFTPPAQKIAYLPLPLRIERLYGILDDATEALYTPPPPPKAPEIIHVLIVEDNPINLKLVQMVLGRYNFHMESARNGEEALQKVHSKRFNLILMDLEMPVMDGYAATEAIRAYEHEKGYDKTAIVALTSRDIQGERETALLRGLDDYLAKPLNISKLEALLERVIGFSRV